MDRPRRSTASYEHGTYMKYLEDEPEIKQEIVDEDYNYAEYARSITSTDSVAFNPNFDSPDEVKTELVEDVNQSNTSTGQNEVKTELVQDVNQSSTSTGRRTTVRYGSEEEMSEEQSSNILRHEETSSSEGNITTPELDSSAAVSPEKSKTPEELPLSEGEIARHREDDSEYALTFLATKALKLKQQLEEGLDTENSRQREVQIEEALTEHERRRPDRPRENYKCWKPDSDSQTLSENTEVDTETSGSQPASESIEQDSRKRSNEDDEDELKVTYHNIRNPGPYLRQSSSHGAARPLAKKTKVHSVDNPSSQLSSAQTSTPASADLVESDVTGNVGLRNEVIGQQNEVLSSSLVKEPVTVRTHEWRHPPVITPSPARESGGLSVVGMHRGEWEAPGQNSMRQASSVPRAGQKVQEDEHAVRSTILAPVITPSPARESGGLSVVGMHRGEWEAPEQNSMREASSVPRAGQKVQEDEHAVRSTILAPVITPLPARESGGLSVVGRHSRNWEAPEQNSMSEGSSVPRAGRREQEDEHAGRSTTRAPAFTALEFGGANSNVLENHSSSSGVSRQRARSSLTNSPESGGRKQLKAGERSTIQAQVITPSPARESGGLSVVEMHTRKWEAPEQNSMSVSKSVPRAGRRVQENEHSGRSTIRAPGGYNWSSTDSEQSSRSSSTNAPRADICQNSKKDKTSRASIIQAPAEVIVRRTTTFSETSQTLQTVQTPTTTQNIVGVQFSPAGPGMVPDVNRGTLLEIMKRHAAEVSIALGAPQGSTSTSGSTAVQNIPQHTGTEQATGVQSSSRIASEIVSTVSTIPRDETQIQGLPSQATSSRPTVIGAPEYERDTPTVPCVTMHSQFLPSQAPIHSVETLHQQQALGAAQLGWLNHDPLRSQVGRVMAMQNQQCSQRMFQQFLAYCMQNPVGRVMAMQNQQCSQRMLQQFFAYCMQNPGVFMRMAANMHPTMPIGFQPMYPTLIPSQIPVPTSGPYQMPTFLAAQHPNISPMTHQAQGANLTSQTQIAQPQWIAPLPHPDTAMRVDNNQRALSHVVLRQNLSNTQLRAPRERNRIRSSQDGISTAAQPELQRLPTSHPAGHPFSVLQLLQRNPAVQADHSLPMPRQERQEPQAPPVSGAQLAPPPPVRPTPGP